ncbi:mannan polymerase complexes subunit Mnn9p [Monosporozyma servazzii]
MFSTGILQLLRGGLTCLALLSTSLIIFKYNDPILGVNNIPHIMDLFEGKWSLQREGTPYFTYNSNYKHQKYVYNQNERFDDIINNAAITHHNLNLINNDPDSIKHNHDVLILTVIDQFNPDYWNNLQELSYPHQNIELGIMVARQDNYEFTLQKLYDIVSAIQTSKNEEKFKKITILLEETISTSNQNIVKNEPLSKDPNLNLEIHKRKSMALMKNELLFATLSPDVSWILWLDGRVINTPISLIQDLTNHGKPILTTNILRRKDTGNGKDQDNFFHPETSNNWVNSQVSMNLFNNLSKNDIFIEGVSSKDTDRPLMTQFYDINSSPLTEMELDSVSTACTLVRSDIHRDGAMFPTFPFYNLIETEGFTKMARRLGYQAFGLPNYVIYMK